MINQRLLLTILVMLLLVTSVQGQDKESQLKAIRKAYAEAKKDMADNGKDGLPRMDIKISVNDGTEVSEDFVINDEGRSAFTSSGFVSRRIPTSSIPIAISSSRNGVPTDIAAIVRCSSIRSTIT